MKVVIAAVANVAMPSIIRIAAPPRVIHFLNKGAFLRSQPVIPPSNNIGDKAVPKPKRIATAKVSTGAAKGNEYNISSRSGGHTTKPLLKPNEKARTSNPLILLVAVAGFSVSLGEHSQEGDLFF